MERLHSVDLFEYVEVAFIAAFECLISLLSFKNLESTLRREGEGLQCATGEQ